MKLNALLAGLLLVPSGVLYGQTATLTAGGEASGTGGAVSFSIGQVADMTAAGSGGMTSQGVQQPYDDVSTVVEGPDPAFAVLAFPTITADLVSVDVPDGQADAWSLRVTDAQGRIVVQRAMHGARTELSLASLATGTYHLMVIADDTPAGTFTIVKIDRP